MPNYHDDRFLKFNLTFIADTCQSIKVENVPVSSDYDFVEPNNTCSNSIYQ